MSSILRRKIEIILDKDHLNAEDVEESKEMYIEALFNTFDWAECRNLVEEILTEDRRLKDYQTMANVIWEAVLDGKNFDSEKIIALLYYRFDPDFDSEDNLVWSIVCKLKNLDYLSNYRPENDETVMYHFNQLKCT